MPGMEPAGVEPIDDIQHEPDQMPRWQPLPQRGRHQELLITINRTIRTSHAPVFRESPQHSRTPPGDLATASATVTKGADTRAAGDRDTWRRWGQGVGDKGWALPAS